MFAKSYEERLQSWSEFRASLEESDDPFRAVVDFYRAAPSVSVHTDPFHKEAWPDPWELLFENRYCDFTRVLAYGYSLQLTDRFTGSSFEIHISTDNVLGYMYLLFVDDFVLGYDEQGAVNAKDLPEDLRSQHVFSLSSTNKY
jgi:hypothetical protein